MTGNDLGNFVAKDFAKLGCFIFCLGLLAAVIIGIIYLSVMENL
jgi:hypothetical protein